MRPACTPIVLDAGSPELGPVLLALARASLDEALLQASRPCPDHAALAAPGATFVTLRLDEELRGCVGSVEPRRPLRADVWENARSAAFKDPRFLPVTAQEYERVRIEVSLLGACAPLDAGDQADALRQLRVGVDGLILSFHGRRATFLPKVWEMLPEPAMFLRELKRKAGLPADFWHAGIELERYEVQDWSEPT